MTGAATPRLPNRGARWSLENLRDVLTGRGATSAHKADSFKALCPVHDDTSPSLSVSWKSGRNGGMTLLHCFGCLADAQDLVDALGLTLADLYDELPTRDAPRPAPRVGRSSQQRLAGARRGKLGRLPVLLGMPDKTAHTWEVVCTYPYVNAAGDLVQEVLREQCSSCGDTHKQFRQVFLTARGDRVKTKPDGFDPVLYRLPQVLAAVAKDNPVWLLEGEKDVAVAETVGVVATTNTGGGGSFPAASAEVFRGATVRVVLDRDKAGYDRGLSLHKLLTQAGATVVLLLPGTTETKSDFADHVAAGLWDARQPHGGLLEVGVAEVAAHGVLATITAKHAGVQQAFEQAQLRLDAAAAAALPTARDEHQQFAKRWAVEAERRYEVITDLIVELRRYCADAATPAAAAAAVLAEETRRRAVVTARAVHELTGVAMPPLLHQPTPSGPGEDSVPLPDGPTGDGADDRGWGGERGGDDQRGQDVEQPVYRIVDGQLVHRTTDKDGVESFKLILGIDARVVEMEFRESEGGTLDVDAPVLQGREGIVGQAEANPPAPDVLSAVVIGFTHPDTGETMRLRIAADDYRDCAWVDSLPGAPAYDSTPRGIAKLRDAMRAVGGKTITRTVRYHSTGWRRDAEGGWFFVHGGGAITPGGAVAAPVMLTGALSRFDLPAPSNDVTRLREAFFDHSAAMLHRLPTRVGAPLLGHIFRSALGPNPWVLALVGSPGSYKTSMAALGMHHWGEEWDRTKPATSMSGNGNTLNAVRMQLSQAKDALFWADDAAPTKDLVAAQKTLEEFARMVHNQEGRARSSRDGQTVLDGTPPRASAIVTSEVTPRPGSGAERMLLVPVTKAEVELDNLLWLDGGDSRFGRAQLMSSFLQWLAHDLECTRRQAFDEAERYADALRERGHAVRLSASLGQIWAGWTAMTTFLTEVGAITTEEREQLLVQIDAGLTETVAAATDPDLPTTTGARVRELLVHALRSGMAYVEDVRDGSTPPWPLAGRLGWRRVSMGFEHGTERVRYDAKGIRFGYVLHDPTATERVAQLLVDPTGLEQVLKAVGSAMSDAPQLDRGTAMRALHEAGVLIAEKNGTHAARLMVKRTLHCEDRSEVRVVALRLHKLLGDPSEGAGEHTDDDGPYESGPLPGESGSTGDTGGDRDDSAPGAGTEADGSAPSETVVVDHSVHGFLPWAQPTVGLTNPAIDNEEPSVAQYSDLDGVSAVAEHFTPPEPCQNCGLLCGMRFDGYVLHIPCWENSGGQRKEQPTAPASSTPPTPVPAPALEPAVPTKPVPTRRQPTVAAAAAASSFAGPAAVLHTDGVWLPDGTRRDLPSTLTHAGHLAELVYELNLGVQVTPFLAEPGQIWVTSQMLAELGVDASGLGEDPAQFHTEMCTLTAGSELAAGALRDGWSFGGKDKDRLGAWTRVYREGGKQGVWVVLMDGIDCTDPVLSDDPDPATLTRRLSLLAGALNAPWVMSGSITGQNLMAKLRRDRKTVFAPSDPVPPAQSSNTEADFVWSRKPTAEEGSLRYVHAYDRGGSYAAGVAGLELGIGVPTHHPDGLAFDKKLPGYWRVPVSDCGDWRLPHPLNPRTPVGSEDLWVSTPTLQLAMEMEYEPQVLEAYTWSEHGRILDGWYERVRDARTGLDLDDVDAQAARDQLKVVYTRTIGMMGSDLFMRGREGYAPERRHLIIAKARSNLLRRIAQIGRDTNQWPLAVVTDTVLYASNEPDPVLAWPGDPQHLGRGFGQFKAEASGLLVDQLKHLTGKGYRGKQHLGAPGSATTIEVA